MLTVADNNLNQSVAVADASYGPSVSDFCAVCAFAQGYASLQLLLIINTLPYFAFFVQACASAQTAQIGGRYVKNRLISTHFAVKKGMIMTTFCIDTPFQSVKSKKVAQEFAESE